MKSIQSKGNVNTGKTITLRDSDGDGIITVLFDSYHSGIDIMVSDIHGNSVSALFDKDEFKRFMDKVNESIGE